MQPAQHAAKNSLFCFADCLKSRHFPSKMEWNFNLLGPFLRISWPKLEFLKNFLQKRLFHEIGFFRLRCFNLKFKISWFVQIRWYRDRFWNQKSKILMRHDDEKPYLTQEIWISIWIQNHNVLTTKRSISVRFEIWLPSFEFWERFFYTKVFTQQIFALFTPPVFGK